MLACLLDPGLRLLETRSQIALKLRSCARHVNFTIPQDIIMGRSLDSVAKTIYCNGVDEQTIAYGSHDAILLCIDLIDHWDVPLQIASPLW